MRDDVALPLEVCKFLVVSVVEAGTRGLIIKAFATLAVMFKLRQTCSILLSIFIGLLSLRDSIPCACSLTSRIAWSNSA